MYLFDFVEAGVWREQIEIQSSGIYQQFIDNVSAWCIKPMKAEYKTLDSED